MSDLENWLLGLKNRQLPEEVVLIVILWLIRDKGSISFEEIAEIVDDTTTRGYKIYSVITALWKLYTHQVINIAGLDIERTIPESTFRSLLRQPDSRAILFEATHELPFLQQTFRISLSALAAELIGSQNAVRAVPIFGKPLPRESYDFAQVFVAMPFADALTPVYENHILPVCKGLNLTCKRGDDFTSSGAIMHEVWSAIYHAKICIVDCTNRNPNVFYELGLAHTIGRPTVLIAQSFSDIPFDIRHLRTIIYDYAAGMEKFEQTLAQTLQQLR